MPTKTVKLPSKFTPKFWMKADQRSFAFSEIKRRYEALKADCGADTVQRDLLCQRATFLALQLETQEITAIEKGVLDAGSYTQSCNALLGLLKALGLDRAEATSTTLKAYVAKKA